MQILFYILFSVTPLILWPKTSELFEFNKMIFVYLLTTLIVAVWAIRCLIAKKFIFRRTLLDIPLLIFLGSQILSTIFSIDLRTSLLGYYSRFNGGLLSSISYSILYWAFVSNMNKEKAVKSIHLLFYSATVVSIIAFLEHFNINLTCALMGQGLNSCWIQDVQNRVFSTLGQPNWLATWIVALIPLTLYQILYSKNVKRILLYLLSLLLFTTLLFTKSRSGLLGFVFADFIFWGFILIKYKKQFLVQTIVLNSLFVVLFFLISSPFTVHRSLVTPPIGPALETGGTESGTIRKIVWKGALQIWLHNPITGSGVETFAFSYYKFRPVEHNLVSEWDFLYNKAHNEYLNFLATSGSVGLLSYLIVIGSSLFIFFKNFQFSVFNFQSNSNLKISKNENSMKIDNYKLLITALGAGYFGLLIANFFGFSTVSTQLEFFLFPAFAITVASSTQYVESKKNTLSNNQKIAVLAILLTTSYILLTILRYWYADTQFAMGKSYNDQGGYVKGQTYLQNAIKYLPSEPIFHSELANSYSGITLSLHELKKDNEALPFIDLAISESVKATTLSPTNVNLLRNQAGVLLKLATIDPKYLGLAKETLISATQKAPTDAKFLYNLALTYMRTEDTDEAVKLLGKVIEMKPNYNEAKNLLNMIHKTF